MILKLKAACLALLLLASALPETYAAQASNTVELLSSSSSVASGENVTITVIGKSFADVYGTDIELIFDVDKLQYTGYSSTLSGEAFIREPDLTGNKIELVFTFIAPKTSGVVGDRNLYTLMFKAVGIGNASVSLHSLSLMKYGQPNPLPLSGTMGEEIKVAVTPANSNNGPGNGPGNGIGTNEDPNSGLNSDTIRLEATTSAIGTASVSIMPSDLLKAAGQSKDGTILIQVNTPTDAKEVQVNLPAAEWLQAAAKSNNTDTVKIEMGMATISLNPKLLQNTQVSETSNLQFSAAKVDPASLSPEARERLGSQTIYDFNLSLDGQKLTRFNGDVKVDLPYVLGLNEKPSQVVVYYITDNGKLEIVKNGKYNAVTGKVEFKPSHFSIYAANHAQVFFRDLDGYQWASEAVLGLAAREIIEGRSEGQYVPEDLITRAEFVKLLVQLFDLEDVTASANFTDVAPGDWYYSSIASAQKTGLIQGKDDGGFGVNDRISREDMAVLIYRASRMLGTSALEPMDTIGKDQSFLDLEQTSVYAKEAVRALQQAGLMNGMNEGYFDPKSSSNRAQAATVLYRLYQNIK